ncbi:MAG: 2-hydroxyglutaryl-CoA dehydratase [Deltaproteobacteria bacterium]|nr:2-hydroxyglutaryl-CoA dehydratase [Deltaproteobacteria bacterium]
MSNKRNYKLESIRAGKELMTLYYVEAKNASHQGKKVAWITSGGPVEPLIALDVIPVYPENHGAMVGAVKNGPMVAERAENLGYPTDLCSYARIDLGQVENPEGSPIWGLPKPDFLVCSNNICGTVVKWYEALARKFDVPLFILDTPYLHDANKETEERAVAYSKAQFSDYLAWLEHVTGRKLKQDDLEESVSLAAEAITLWKKCLEHNKHRPAPMTCFDAFVLLAPIVTLRGTSRVVNFYKDLDDELASKVENDSGAVPDERIRLLWDNIPVWFAMRFMADTLAEQGANLVCDTYTTAWADADLKSGSSAVIETLARAYTVIYLNQGIRPKLGKMIDLIEQFDCQGVVMHSNRSCKPYSFGQYDIQRLLRDEEGIPVMLLEADMTDSRMFHEAQVETRLKAFLESIS